MRVLSRVSPVAEFTVPPSEFALDETFGAAPELFLGVERAAAHRLERAFSLCWVTGDDYRNAESALQIDPTIESIAKLSESDRAWLYRVEWTEAVERFLSTLRAKGYILESSGTADGWSFRVFFEDHGLLSEIHSDLIDEGVDFTLDRLYELRGPDIDGRLALTQKQRDILVTAAEAGYFETPRELTMTELADALGISQQAASARLRRAHAALIGSVFQIERGER